jgi:DNA-binding SARP family transcriptional activator
VLRVKVLGQLALEVDGTDLELPSSWRARSLLALLALDRRVHPRSQLAGRFWPDVLEESARTSLRSALSALRKALGPDAGRYLKTGHDGVALAGPDEVWTDIGEFERLVSDGQAQAALELARGELLADLDDDWVHERRERHREQVSELLAGLAAAAEGDGDLAAAIAHTRRQAALDPLAEEPHRQLLRRLAAAGDRAGALVAYKRLSERLRSDLGIMPSAATRELAESLRGESVTVAPKAVESTGPVTVRPSGTVTLLFTDQVSSTEALERLGDDAAERLRRVHFRRLREVSSAHGGREVKNLGDGLMVAFASALDAVAAAIAIQQAVHRSAREDPDLAVRVGLNVGEPIREEDDYFGTPVVVAKRLCDAAEAGQILASQLVRSLVGTRGGFSFRDLGKIPLKGIAHAPKAYEVVWQPTTEQRIPLPGFLAETHGTGFVGRETALAALEDAFGRARAGERRVVLIAGDPGIGKTRLTTQFCTSVHAQGGAVLGGRCYEETLVPYQPVVEALRHYVAGCPPSELTVQLVGKRGQLAALVPELGEDGPDRTGALDAAEQERMRLFEAVTDLVRELSELRPAVLVLDDLHWADAGTMLLLRHVVRASESSPLLILGTYRQTELPRDHPLIAAIGELRRVRALDEISLHGLTGPEVAQLVTAASDARASDEFVAGVAAHTEGNPFFIEEVLRQVDPGEWSSAAAVVPESVKDLLLRRMRQLSEECRRTLATAAVAGREFEMAVLMPVLEVGEESLLDQMEEALASQVLVEASEAPGTYRFAHALIRETIYDQLSATRRALLHRRIAEATETVFADRLDQAAGTLAYHYRAAGNLEKAFEYHVRAADTADRVFARETALEQFSAAIVAGELLGLAPETDRRMRELYWRRGAVRRYDQPEESLEDWRAALTAAQAAGDGELEMHVLNGMGTVMHVRDVEGSISYHEQALRIAEALNDGAGRVSALNRLCLAYANYGDFARAVELGERALAVAEAASDEVAVANAMDGLKFCALQLGDVPRLDELTTQLIRRQRQRGDVWFLMWTLLESAYGPMARREWAEASRRLDEALTLARRMPEPLTITLTLDAARWLEQQRGDYRHALEHGHAAMEHAPDAFLAWAAAGPARLLLDLLAGNQALEIARRGLDAAERVDARGQIFRILGELIDAHRLRGEVDEALTLAARVRELDQRITVPPGFVYMWGHGAYLAVAEAELAGHRPDRAEAALRPLLEPVERSGIASERGGIAIAWGHCLSELGRRDEAAGVLRRGLAAVGEEGMHSWRWRLHAALAGLTTGEEAAEHRRRAETLIDEMAQSVADPALAEGFRRAASEQLSSHSTS